jgi:hypothetical protein
MSPGQNTKYWKRWGFVVRQNNWRWIKGRLVAEAVRDAGQHHVAVWRLAETLADQGCRAVIANDLRHACHIHAFGRDVSSKAFTNDQFSRLLLLWGDEREIPGLLIDPEHIATLIAWDNPSIARKNSLIRSIEDAADEEYICSITVDVWGTKFWRELDTDALLGLLRKIKGNAPARAGNPF